LISAPAASAHCDVSVSIFNEATKGMSKVLHLKGLLILLP
jgi:hypothetical protein